jgi:hypothetical protein
MKIHKKYKIVVSYSKTNGDARATVLRWNNWGIIRFWFPVVTMEDKPTWQVVEYLQQKYLVPNSRIIWK